MGFTWASGSFAVSNATDHRSVIFDTVNYRRWNLSWTSARCWYANTIAVWTTFRHRCTCHVTVKSVKPTWSPKVVGLSLKSGAEWSSSVCTVMFANRLDHNVQGRFVSASHSGDLHYISQSAVKGTSSVAPTNSRSLESIIVRNFMHIRFPKHPV